MKKQIAVILLLVLSISVPVLAKEVIFDPDLTYGSLPGRRIILIQYLVTKELYGFNFDKLKGASKLGTGMYRVEVSPGYKSSNQARENFNKSTASHEQGRQIGHIVGITNHTDKIIGFDGTDELVLAHEIAHANGANEQQATEIAWVVADRLEQLDRSLGGTTMLRWNENKNEYEVYRG